jgi:hypothetical protein
MGDSIVLMGSFQDLERAADALDQLRALNIANQDITVLSSLPYSHKALGRPEIKTWLPVIAMASAAMGLVAGLFFTVVTPNLYVIRVGGQPIVPGPTTALLLFEFTMLLLVLGTFVGVVALNSLRSVGPQYDGPALTDDRIGVLFRCPNEKEDDARAVLESQGAENIHEPQLEGGDV